MSSTLLPEASSARNRPAQWASVPLDVAGQCLGGWHRSLWFSPQTMTEFRCVRELEKRDIAQRSCFALCVNSSLGLFLIFRINFCLKLTWKFCRNPWSYVFYNSLLCYIHQIKMWFLLDTQDCGRVRQGLLWVFQRQTYIGLKVEIEQTATLV